MAAKKNKGINPESKDHYYAGRQTNIQETLHRIFIERYGISIGKMVECLEELRLRKDTKEQMVGRASILKMIRNGCWDEFILLLSERTGKTFRKNPRGRTWEDSYDEWWQRCNIDGTFAYNGVTDDF